jgi:hypothetical protein
MHVFVSETTVRKKHFIALRVGSLEMTALQYHPLHPQKDTIQLLTIFLGKADEQIQCKV